MFGLLPFDNLTDPDFQRALECFVTFASDETEEDAEDLGGPRRECFCLLVREDSGAFEGKIYPCV